MSSPGTAAGTRVIFAPGEVWLPDVTVTNAGGLETAPWLTSMTALNPLFLFTFNQGADTFQFGEWEPPKVLTLSRSSGGPLHIRASISNVVGSDALAPTATWKGTISIAVTAGSVSDPP